MLVLTMMIVLITKKQHVTVNLVIAVLIESVNTLGNVQNYVKLGTLGGNVETDIRRDIVLVIRIITKLPSAMRAGIRLMRGAGAPAASPAVATVCK